MTPESVNLEDSRLMAVRLSRDIKINERDQVLRDTALPNIGSFCLIKDLVRDYTDLSQD